MQRLFNLSKWTELRDGEALPFKGARPRTVRLELNAPDEVSLYSVENGEPIFLALVRGRDVVEFAPDGEFALAVEGGTVFVYTADGQDVHSIAPDPVIFTKIAERRRRDPAMELMMYEMNRNIEKRLQAQHADFERIIAAREAAGATPVAPAAAGTPANGTPEPVSAPVATPAPDTAVAGDGADG